jgi:hypothetical protein
MSLYHHLDEPSKLARAVEDLHALDRHDALQLADQILDALIDTLRRDPGIPPRSHAEWAVMLAPLHLRIAEGIHLAVDGRVVLDEVLVTIEAMGV